MQANPITPNTNLYHDLCDTMSLTPIHESLSLNNFSAIESIANTNRDQRLAAALHVLLEIIAHDADQPETIDPLQIDYYLAKINQRIHQQLDEILHHPDFQALESAWCSLKYLVDKTDFQANTKIDILSVCKNELAEEFNNASDFTQTTLYRHVYVEEYDTPGGEPIAAMIADHEFGSDQQDVNLLQNIANVAAATHCPFIAAAGPAFFNKNSIADIAKIDDLDNYLQRAEFIRWQSFRNSANARYIGLTLPRFLLRQPYGRFNPTRNFYYPENVIANNADKFLWAKANFAFAANMLQSFKNNGWLVNIRGPESGGKVTNLPLFQFPRQNTLETKIPTEMLIPETLELALAEQGFIPLSYYKNSDHACFFSANSCQQPQQYLEPQAHANSRINSRLPYVFLSARLAHYLKVLQRENIGANKSRSQLEKELNRWLQTLVTKMNHPDPELIATHPLREGMVSVNNIPDNPGFYSVTLHIVPHFQVEGIDVRLSLSSQLPSAIAN